MRLFPTALLTLMLLSSACTPGFGRPRPGLALEVDAVFEDIDSADSPGGTVAVIQNGEMLYTNGYGSAQLEYRIPNTPKTIFHVASVSKQFTAMAVTLLAADGALSLDDPVQKHLEYVPDLGRPITVRQLIHHTSGIRDQWDLLAIAGWRLDDVITTDHVIRLMSRQQELNFEPNSEYSYSNMGYTLLAEIARAVSGIPFPELTEQRIFAPLGMTRTHFHDDHQHAVEDRAYSYSPLDGGSFQKRVLSYANAGATSLFTTAEDLALWLDNFRHASVGGPEVTAMMTTPGTLTGGETIDYAHGLAIGEYRGRPTIGHSGGDAGFRSHVVWFPDDHTGVVVLMNHGNGNPGRRALQVADVVLDDVLEAETNELTTAERTPGDLDKVPGLFLTTFGAIVSIEESGDQLLLHFPQGLPQPLTPTGARSFRAGDEGVFLKFEADWASVTFTGTDGTAVGTAKRLDDFAPSPDELVDLEGTYYSPEVEALYRIEAAGENLTAHHVRHGTINLMPLFPDVFASDQWFFSNVRFERNPGGTVAGLRVSGERVRNLRFVKLASPLPK